MSSDCLCQKKVYHLFGDVLNRTNKFSCAVSQLLMNPCKIDGMIDFQIVVSLIKNKFFISLILITRFNMVHLIDAGDSGSHEHPNKKKFSCMP